MNLQLFIGPIDTRASDNLDTGILENEGPPAPPSGLYARFPISGTPTGLIPDVRNYTGFPFTGSHTLTLEVLNLVAGNSLTIDFPAGIEAQLTDKITGTIFNETLSSSSTVELHPAIGSYNCILTFTDFTPPVSTKQLSLKSFLEGPFNSGSMSTSLNSQIPINQPFNSTPWNYTGNESAASVPAAAVDWVLVELRDKNDNSSTTARKAGFILTDGMIVDVDGTSPLSFDIASDEYYVVVNHRNHLTIMSSQLVNIQ